MIKPLPIIFQEISDAPTHLEKVQALQQNRNAMVDLLLELTFSKDIMITGLPEGKPSLTTGEAALFNAHLLYANRRIIEMFINDNSAHIPPIKREKIFLDFLENLDPSEVTLICEVKDRKLTSFPGITKKVVEKVYDWPIADDTPEVAEAAPVEETPAPVVEEVKVEEPVVVEPEVKKTPAKKPAAKRKPAAKKAPAKKAPAKKTTTRRKKPAANTSPSTS